MVCGKAHSLVVVRGYVEKERVYGDLVEVVGMAEVACEVDEDQDYKGK